MADGTQPPRCRPFTDSEGVVAAQFAKTEESRQVTKMLLPQIAYRETKSESPSCESYDGYFNEEILG
jgi:hypothetical protein